MTDSLKKTVTCVRGRFTLVARATWTYITVQLFANGAPVTEAMRVSGDLVFTWTVPSDGVYAFEIRIMGIGAGEPAHIDDISIPTSRR